MSGLLQDARDGHSKLLQQVMSEGERDREGRGGRDRGQMLDAHTKELDEALQRVKEMKEIVMMAGGGQGQTLRDRCLVKI